MLDDFRRLPPLVRILVVVIGVAVVLGIVAVIIIGITKPKDATPTQTPNATASDTPNPNGTYTGPGVDPTFTTPPSPLPTAVSTPTDSAPTGQNGIESTALSDAEKTKAFVQASKGLEEWCSYNRDESQSAHLKRIQPYFVKGAKEAQAGQYIGIIEDQQCAINAGQPQKVLSKNHVQLVMYTSIVTIYGSVSLNGASSSATNNKSELDNTPINVDAYKVDGKWLIGTIER